MAIPGLVPALVGAGADILGGLLGNAFSSAAEVDAFSNQASLMQRQFELNREMMNYRHQWEQWDLKQAGLNPILTALNGAPSMATTGLAQMQQRKTPDFDFGKAASAFANSALAQKQLKIAEFQADTDRMKAEADYIRAHVEESKSPSAIWQAETQAKLNEFNIENGRNMYQLQKAMNEAQVSKINQDIINAAILTAAQAEMYHKTGDAALMQASASQSMAGAAWAQAEIAQKVGMSEVELKNQLAGKAGQETLEAFERTKKAAEEAKSIEWNRKVSETDHPTAYYGEGTFGGIIKRAGEYLKSLSPLNDYR